jgi:N utilization substance protein A
VSRKIKISESSSVQPRSELLQVADAVAREKGIEPSEVLRAMELALEKAAKSKYGEDSNIEVTISLRTGETKFIRHRKIVEGCQKNISEISLEDALKIDPLSKIDGIVSEELPPIDFGRVAAQSARNIVFQKVREAERTRQYEEFKDRIGDIITSTVKRVEFGDVFVELGHAEGILRKDGLIPRETFRVGDRIRALIANLRPEPYGPLVVLSRTHPQFMERLFEQEVPEIYDGVIQIKGVERDSGML